MLYIQYGPNITHIESLSTVLVNQSITLSCEAYGDPLPSYIWQHNGMSISYTSVYVKSHATAEDSGSYTCIAINIAGGILMSDNKTVEVMVLSSFPPPRNFRHTLHGYNVSFSWEDPMLPSNIQLTNYMIAYNFTDAFNQELKDSILISGEDSSYVFNTTCSYEAELALCPLSHYCFTLSGAYYKNRTAIETAPTNKICFDTPKYPLYVSFKNVHYNVTEGTKLNITVISSRAFTTNFNITVNSLLITATAADFDILSSYVLFDPSSGQETMFTINILDNTKYEIKDSSFIIMLKIPEAAKLLGVTLEENSFATISIIDNDKFRDCESEIDTQWSIQWNKTSPVHYNIQNCPGEFSIVTGMSFRLCKYGGIWQQPDVSDCATIQFVNIKNKTEELNTTDVKNASDILNQLANITKPTSLSQLPKDISVAVGVLETVIKRLNDTNEEKLEESLEDNSDLIDNAINVVNNLLTETNLVGWAYQNQEESTGETLLESAEAFGRIVSSTLIKNTSNVNATQLPGIEKENIVLQTVQLTKEEITEMESAGYIPFLTSTNYTKFQGKNISVNYPSNTIKERLLHSKSIIFINMILSNLGDFLTAGNIRVQAISDIISTQIKWNQSNNFTNEPIELFFEVPEIENYTNHNISCVYWQFHINPLFIDTLTSWSKDGIVTDVVANSTTIKCLSNHLSSFAVIAEDSTIEIPPEATDSTATTSATVTTAETTITTTQKTVITDVSTTSPTDNINCCCNEETQKYRDFSITWNVTLVNETVSAECKGDELKGNVTRTCGLNNEWLPAKVYCIREQISMVFAEIIKVTQSFKNLTTTDQINKINTIVKILASVTTPDDVSQYPQELETVVNIISSINNYTDRVIDMRQPNDTFFEETAQIFDNLLNPSNEEGWVELQEISSEANQDLVKNAEQFGQLLARTLSEEVPETIKSKNNIVIKAQITTADNIKNLEGNPLQFPDEDDIDLINENFVGLKAQISIPNKLLYKALNTTNETKLPVVNIVFRNLASVLPNISLKNADTRPISAVLSSQLSTKRFSTSIPILLKFEINKDKISSDLEQSCGFWDFGLIVESNSTIYGGWSREGVEFVQENSNNVSTVCHSYHLTSFAVLVSAKHEPEQATEAEALTVISYIGCCISIVCLLISIVVLSICIFKNFLKGTHVFVHLNLCIALLMGNIVFVSGIDAAADNRGGCIFVAVLLQYFFTSAFCWMLCEGIILYMLLVVVFKNKFNRRLFYFALGWGPAVPIVAISVGIAHNQYGIDYCWISTENGAIAAFIVPMGVIILINCVFLGFALRALYRSKSAKITAKETNNIEMAKHLTKGTFVLLPLLGLTWLIGIISINNDTTVFAWIFTILNSLQGMFILFFHVLRNQEIKKHLWSSISGKKQRLMRPSLLSTKTKHSMRSSSTTSTTIKKQFSRSNVPSSSHSEVPMSPMSLPMSKCDSTVFSEGYLATTLDRKDNKRQHGIVDTSFQNDTTEKPVTTSEIANQLHTISKKSSIQDIKDYNTEVEKTKELEETIDLKTLDESAV